MAVGPGLLVWARAGTGSRERKQEGAQAGQPEGRMEGLMAHRWAAVTRVEPRRIAGVFGTADVPAAQHR